MHLMNDQPLMFIKDYALIVVGTEELPSWQLTAEAMGQQFQNWENIF